jgi:hypothetical protein
MSLTAPNPSFNASINDGNDLAGKIVAERLSANPRLYAQDIGTFYPATDAQDNSDLPAWVVLGTSLASRGQDPSEPIYLHVWVSERQNFFDVAQVKRQADAGVPLDLALR